jgi:thioredoxin 2
MASLQIDDRGVVVSCGNCGQKNRVAFQKLGHTAKCGQCHQEIRAGATPLEVASTADFERLVAESAVPVEVEYWAPWCGPCRVVAPELEKVAQRAAGRYLVVKVNTDALSDLGETHRIRSIPTLAVFSHGREVTRTAGARPAPEIEAFIGDAIRPLASR